MHVDTNYLDVQQCTSFISQARIRITVNSNTHPVEQKLGIGRIHFTSQRSRLIKRVETTQNSSKIERMSKSNRKIERKIWRLILKLTRLIPQALARCKHAAV